MRAIIVLALCFAAVAAVPENPQRIVGGSVTTINQYPSITALLATSDWSSWWQSCGGTIINTRSVLTAAHCVYGDPIARWRIRFGSTWANSGGTVNTISTYILHPNYNHNTLNFDFAVVRSASTIFTSATVRPAAIAGAYYYLADNQPVWAAGWGHIQTNGPSSEQLRHVQIWTVNQAVCRQRYATRGANVLDNMLCAGWLDVGGRDQCQGDSGGPLFHNNVVVGVTSWGYECANSFFPGVNARVSSAIAWIRQNA